MKLIVLVISLLILLPMINAELYSDNTIYGTQKEKTSKTTSITNYYNATNNTDYWDTNIGSLDDVNDTQFDNSAGTLTIDHPWLNSLYCKLTGCTMTGDLQTSEDIILTTEGAPNAVIRYTSGILGILNTSIILLNSYTIINGDLDVVGDGNFTGNVYADEYCNETGSCYDVSELVGGGGSGVSYQDFTIDIKSSKYNDIHWDISDSDAEDVIIQPNGEIKYVFGREII